MEFNYWDLYSDQLHMRTVKCRGIEIQQSRDLPYVGTSESNMSTAETF